MMIMVVEYYLTKIRDILLNRCYKTYTLPVSAAQ